MTTRKTQFTEKKEPILSKAAMAETRFMEERIMISSRAMAIGTLFTAEREMTRSTEIEGLIGSGATKEMIFFTVLARAREQIMAAAELMEAPEMTPLKGPEKETLFTVDLAMTH